MIQFTLFCYSRVVYNRLFVKPHDSFQKFYSKLRTRSEKLTQFIDKSPNDPIKIGFTFCSAWNVREVGFAKTKFLLELEARINVCDSSEETLAQIIQNIRRIVELNPVELAKVAAELEDYFRQEKFIE